MILEATVTGRNFTFSFSQISVMAVRRVLDYLQYCRFCGQNRERNAYGHSISGTDCMLFVLVVDAFC
jgi:hypothetical protein